MTPERRDELGQQHPRVIDVDAARRPMVMVATAIALGVVVLATFGYAGLRYGGRAATPPPASLSKPAEVPPAPAAPAPAVPEPSPANSPAPALSPAELAQLQKNATVRGGALTVLGRLDIAAVQQRVRTLNDRFLHCYTQGLSRVPTLSGRLTLKFVVETTGAISHVDASPPSLPDELTERCVVAALTPLTFPKPSSGTATVQYPLIFRTD